MATTGYVEWNSLLLAELFSPASCDEEVWLQVTREELDSFGLHLGGTEGLLAATRQGPPWMPEKRHWAEMAARLARQRTAGVRADDYGDPGVLCPEYAGTRPPAYLPYVAVWILASSEAEGGFYRRVDALLANTVPWQNQHYAAMSDVWADLENWSIRDAAGFFGQFHVRVLGDHRFVGIPKSQCMVSRKDHDAIERLFHGLALKPGQALTDDVFQALISQGEESHFLSAGLRDAMRKQVFHEPLRRVLAAKLEAWDGRTSRALEGAGNAPGETVTSDNQEDCELEATISLVPGATLDVDWEMRWRIPALVYSGVVKIEQGGVTWDAQPDHLGLYAASDMSSQDAIRAALQQSAKTDVVLQAAYVDEVDDNGERFRRLTLRSRRIRALAWDSAETAGGVELVERELPIAGPAYLLCGAEVERLVKRYLSQENIAHKDCSSGGLPTGWHLVCVLQCERLSWEHRNWLSGGTAGAPAAARIRLSGGRPITRGGIRRYAFYDLPLVELEAPEGTELAAEGLRLHPIDLAGPVNPLVGVLRFRIDEVVPNRSSFEICARKDSEIIARTRLRITAAGGTAVSDSEEFGLDPLGRVLRKRFGLRGLLPQVESGGGLSSQVDELDLVELAALGEELADSTADTVSTESAGIRFLDSLAQLGSISYGAARAQLGRLTQGSAGQFSAALALLELRSTGHLELETDGKGHLARVHAVPPTLYSLAVVHDGLSVFGVCGTLRLQQWKELSRHPDGVAVIERRDRSILPVLRLLATSEVEGRLIAERSGLEFATAPSLDVARWAGSIDTARAELTGFGWETLVRNVRGLQRLHPESAQFVSSTGQASMRVPADLGCVLFRFEDPDIAGQQVYVLGMASTDALPRYSYVHDSRWGVWLAIRAFAEMARSKYQISDALPWPIPYDRVTRTLWLPARLRPPFVIERALTLCSGSPPVAIEAKGASSGDSIVLCAEEDGRLLGRTSLVYSSMATGHWLAYRWVPACVAEAVAESLGGIVRDF